MANLIYEGPLRVFEKDKNGNPYVIKKGNNEGKHYRRLSFKSDAGETIYLPDFAGKSDGMNDGDLVKLAYSIQTDEWGEALLYEGMPQYKLEEIKLLEDGKQPSGGQAARRDTFDPQLSAKQTALGRSAELAAAGIIPLDQLFEQADAHLRWLLATPLERAIETTPPDADDKPDPVGDEDIPF